jgi:hypothetical protein
LKPGYRQAFYENIKNLQKTSNILEISSLMQILSGTALCLTVFDLYNI